LGGANAGDFAQQSNTCGSTLKVRQSCVVTLTFKPTATSKRTASLVITDNGGGSPQNVGLSGVGN
jgi:hypothetical protein